MNRFHVRANVVERLGHFYLIVPSLAHNLTKQHSVRAEEASFAKAIFSFFCPLGTLEMSLPRP